MRVLRLRSKLGMALLLVALVPLAVTTGVLVTINLERLEADAKEYRMAVADGAVRLVRTTLERTRSELTGIGAALAEEGASVDDRLRAARAQLLGAQFVDQVALYDREGRHVETLSATATRISLPRPPALDAPLREQAIANGAVWQDVARAPSGPLRLPLLLPVYRGTDRRLYGFVWSTVSLDPLGRELAGMSRLRFLGQAHRIFAFDAHLRVVLHADPGALFGSVAGRGLVASLEAPERYLRTGAADFGADYEVEGEDLLGVLVPLPELAWGVVVEQPARVAYRVVRETWQTALAVGLGAALAAALLGLFLARRLAAPVAAVAAAARQVAAGDFAVRVPEPARDEVGEMAVAFNGMAQDLVAYRDRLVEETRVRSNLSRYLSADVVEAVVRHQTELQLGGERREVAVLFADLAGFTPLTVSHPPEQIVAVLNELFTFLTEIILRHGGIVDKFLGDCVMGVFGAPYRRGDESLRAVRAADEMMRWLEVGNARWEKELGQPLRLAIGLSSGVAIAGNLGSAKRMEYTVIGDVVNVAARLETIARPGQVLMTRETAEAAASEYDTVLLATTRLAGRTEDTEIHALAER